MGLQNLSQAYRTDLSRGGALGHDPEAGIVVKDFLATSRMLRGILAKVGDLKGSAPALSPVRWR